MKTFSVQLLSWNALHRTAFLKGQSDGLPEQLESPVSIYDYKWAIYFNWCVGASQNKRMIPEGKKCEGPKSNPSY
jgi:hypothetical protein